MLLSEDKGIGDYHIRAYTSCTVTVNETTYSSSLIVSPHQIVPHWPPTSFDQLKADHFKPIWSLHPEIVILGIGKAFKILAPQHLLLFYKKRIGIEPMNTDAACRTYTALLAENRKVVAALLLN